MTTKTTPINIKHIQQKITSKESLSFNEGVYLMREAELLEIQPIAQQVRFFHNPKNTVTYVVDTNLNYTNICDAYCSFCAFYKTDPSDPSAYTYTVEQVINKIARAREKGIRTVLMQGGLNSNIPFDYYTSMVEESVRRFPEITPHFWSAPEIHKMSNVSGKTIKEVLSALWNAGQTTMPGGGSEILSNRVKQKISRFKPKDTWQDWATVHLKAHEVGFKTTATMMYGHVEEAEDIIESIIHIRDIQKSAITNKNGGGFTAFIPWSYKSMNTALSSKVHKEAGPNVYLRIIAVSRLMLDNIPHIQASWFSEGKRTGQVALHFGADDFGGTLFDENVMLSAGFFNRTDIAEIRALIEDVGFEPTERLTDYSIVEQSAVEVA